MNKFRTLFRRLLLPAAAVGALSLTSCATYVADGYYGAGTGYYGGGDYYRGAAYCPPVSTVYVAPRTYCAPTYYAPRYYSSWSSCHTPYTSHYVPRYYSGSCGIGYAGSRYSGGHYSGGHHYSGGSYGGRGCR
jgi:hypothetical protein